MKVLLDENLPHKLKYEFGSEDEVFTVSDLSWNSMDNGDLLQAMKDNGFEILITADINLRFQQNIEKYGIILVVLYSKDNRYETLLPFIAKVKEKLKSPIKENFIPINL